MKINYFLKLEQEGLFYIPDKITVSHVHTDQYYLFEKTKISHRPVNTDMQV